MLMDHFQLIATKERRDHKRDVNPTHDFLVLFAYFRG